MIPNDQPLRKQTITRMINTVENNIEDAPENYSDWEKEFIQSVLHQMNIKGDISSRQCEILERIYDK